MNKIEKKWASIVSTLPCACCGDAGNVELHHAREGQGGAQRAGNFLVMPLCRACHGQDLGSQGFHGDKTLMRIYKTDEMKMLNDTVGAIFKRVMHL